MAIHLCRDYLTQNVSTANRQYISSYITSIFLRRVLGYSYVGDTNYPINALGNLLISTGDSTPTAASPTFSVNTKAGIANNGANIEVSIPVGIKGVASADVGRMLFLKSSLYPTRNSGAFLITSIQQGNATTIAAGSNGASLPQGTINVTSTTGFPTSGTIYIGPSTTTTTVVVLTGTFTLTVGSTTGFPSSGNLTVLSTTGTQTVAYTGLTASTFTGCTGGSGSTFAGGTVTTSNNIQTITYTGITGTTFTGCTGGTGTLITGEPVYNQNKYVIDYRGNGELSLPESTDTVPWYLYDKDINCPINGASNGGAGYKGYGASTTPRIILQSPHGTGWQVRICNEVSSDHSTDFCTNAITFCPGFNGDSAGDFLIGGKHLHGALYNNSTNSLFNTGTGCGDSASTGPQYRYTLVGDDTGQNFHIFARRPLNATTPRSFYLSFGMPDNEPSPLPIDNTERLYALGNARSNDTGGNFGLNDISLSVGTAGSSNPIIQGASFRHAPISCSPSLWTYLTGVNQLASGMYDASAGDCPFTSATELLPVDLVVGTVGTWLGSTSTGLQFNPRVIGKLTLIK